MQKIRLYLSLGSNLGDREENIRKALSLLDEELKTPYKAVSSFIETEPWGFESDDRFINAVVLYEIDLPDDFEPEEEGLRILRICKKTERILGRTEEPEYDDSGNRLYKSRTIDVDILLLGDERVDSEELTIPHKLMEKRDFVMVPLRQIMNRNEC
ncbi:MAG: 2-amino-4-hydroxy-6-hydroxymethyldihydropteridine diphosphokinase [Bacteroidales bacterium]|nr:2-amino-4-hydroxy-6-hydroxymethyldihydropteridine diphosphokinase [Bacteroidales bacterium]